ncbi:transposase [Amycolatopsis jiangsuensis]|uniref:transposase n=1 Tax=Amycolatopsis jiangsuensis TaxID=1181879 RepID=UPI0016087E12
METSNTRRIHSHGGTTEVPGRVRERAARLVVEARRDLVSAAGAIKRVADQLGVHPEALRTWVKQAETARDHEQGPYTPISRRGRELVCGRLRARPVGGRAIWGWFRRRKV